MLLTILIFIFILGLLVFVHEFGHFIVAKRRGVGVEEFGFGFPPRLIGIKRGETIYSLNLIPLGGFVRIVGEATGGEGRATEASGEASQVPGTPDRSFATRSFGERAAIVMAGIIGNVLLAAVLFSIAHGIGVATVVEGDETDFRNVAVTIVFVAPGSPAAEGGLKSGDNILRIVDARGERLDPVRRVEEVQEFIQAHRGEPLRLSIERVK
ncbi:MAG: site-2 protease family protein, partial [bacterium]|nr:site-2 protease family protein [bacterium]